MQSAVQLTPMPRVLVQKEAMKAQLEKETEIRAKMTELLEATNPAIDLFKVDYCTFFFFFINKTLLFYLVGYIYFVAT